MLLQELLSIIAERDAQALLESYGNLKKIDPQLLKAFVMQDGKVDKNLGEHSEVEVNPKITDYQSFEDAFVERDDTGVIGFIFVVDGKQAMSVAHIVDLENSPNHRDEKKIHVGVTKAFADLFDEDYIQKHYMTNIINAANRGFPVINSQFSHVSNTVRNFFDVVADKKLKLETIEVKTDFKRLDKQAKRTQLKRGHIPLPGYDNKLSKSDGAAYKSYLEKLKTKLEAKLDQLKRDKLKNATTPEEMVKIVKEDGFGDKIKFMGFTYKRIAFRVDYDHLHKIAQGKGDVWSENNYVQYTVEWEDKAYQKIQEELWDLMPTNPSKVGESEKEEAQELWDAWERLQKRKIPPNSLKIIIGLKGGVASPVDIKLERN